MILKVTGQSGNEYRQDRGYGVFEEDGTLMSWAGAGIQQTRYCNTFLKGLSIGGIGTAPMYRRRGCVRLTMEAMLDYGMENGCAVAVLHPFSFAYYRKFGFEKVADHKVIEFPMSAIAYIDRNPDFVPYTKQEQLPGLLKLHNEFTKNRNIMFLRWDGGCFPLNNSARQTFIHSNGDGEPDGYVTLQVEDYFETNRMASISLTVHQLGYTSKEALKAIFGFLRMYEGQLDTVKILNAAMCPEIDMILRNYMHTSYKIIPDLMIRILDVSAVLKANAYPNRTGHFTLRVNDIFEQTRGCYEVTYGNGEVSVIKKPLSDEYDICADIRALAQLLYGYEEYDMNNAVYMEGVEVREGSEDFFLAFRKKFNGVFEHF